MREEEKEEKEEEEQLSALLPRRSWRWRLGRLGWPWPIVDWLLQCPMTAGPGHSWLRPKLLKGKTPSGTLYMRGRICRQKVVHVFIHEKIPRSFSASINQNIICQEFGKAHNACFVHTRTWHTSSTSDKMCQLRQTKLMLLSRINPVHTYCTFFLFFWFFLSVCTLAIFWVSSFSPNEVSYSHTHVCVALAATMLREKKLDKERGAKN